MKKKKVRILFLDDAILCLPDLNKYGVNSEFIFEAQLNKSSVYRPDERLYGLIGAETMSEKYDLVVIGNNRRAGIKKAAAVAEHMKDKTLIVWNLTTPEEEAFYAAIGFKHFATRSDLRKLIPRMLGLS